jgi:hypothetical protein
LENNLIKSISYKNQTTTYGFTHNPTNTLKDVTDNLGRMFSFSYCYTATIRMLTKVALNDTAGAFRWGDANFRMANWAGFAPGLRGRCPQEGTE